MPPVAPMPILPYRIRSYDQIRRDPQETIDFDFELAGVITRELHRWVPTANCFTISKVNRYHATLGEKLLVPALVKIANFVPGGGVWLIRSVRSGMTQIMPWWERVVRGHCPLLASVLLLHGILVFVA